jgi:hypothetical protein
VLKAVALVKPKLTFIPPLELAVTVEPPQTI